ncbi:MAG: hypothetical protein AB1467_02310 [Candidatus Diapherotrites archaeon]
MPEKDGLDPLVRMKKMNAMFGGKAKLAEVRKKLGQDYELIGPKKTIREPISDEEAKKKMEEELGVIKEEEKKEPWQEINEIKKELKKQLTEKEEKKEELEEEVKPEELEDKGIEFDLRKELESKKAPAEEEKELRGKFAFKKEFAPKEKEKPLTSQQQMIKPFEMEAKQKKPEPWIELEKEKKPLIEEKPKKAFALEKFEVREEPKKEEQKRPFAKPSPDWLKEIDKKFSETEEPKELVFNSIITEKAESTGPPKKEKIETEGIRIEPIKTKKQTEEENMLKGFVFGEEGQIQPGAESSKEELLEKLKEGIETKKPEEKMPVDNIIKLTKIIPKNVEEEFREKEPEEKEGSDSLGKQLGSITSFFSSNITKSMGGKPISGEELEGLTNEEKKEIKKLVSTLGPATKKYTKEEIYESMILENKSKKVAEKVISILYQE